MSPLTFVKTTPSRLAARPARPAATPPAAQSDMPTAPNARDGGERARSGADVRKRSAARGGALQNDDGNVYLPVGRRTRSCTKAQAKDALCCFPAGEDDNDGGRRERSLCENKATGLIRGSADRVRLVENRNVSLAGAFEDVTRAETELVLSRPAVGDHNLNSKVMMVPDRPREVSVSRDPTDDNRKGASTNGHYRESRLFLPIFDKSAKFFLSENVPFR